MKTISEKRINRAVGQLNALGKTLRQQKYDCVEVITQLKAIMGSVRSLGKHIAQEELKRCSDSSMSLEEKTLKINAILSVAF